MYQYTLYDGLELKIEPRPHFTLELSHGCGGPVSAAAVLYLQLVSLSQVFLPACFSVLEDFPDPISLVYSL